MNTSDSFCKVQFDRSLYDAIREATEARKEELSSLTLKWIESRERFEGSISIPLSVQLVTYETAGTSVSEPRSEFRIAELTGRMWVQLRHDVESDRESRAGRALDFEYDLGTLFLERFKEEFDKSYSRDPNKSRNTPRLTAQTATQVPVSSQDNYILHETRIELLPKQPSFTNRVWDLLGLGPRSVSQENHDDYIGLEDIIDTRITIEMSVKPRPVKVRTEEATSLLIRPPSPAEERLRGILHRSPTK